MKRSPCAALASASARRCDEPCKADVTCVCCGCHVWAGGVQRCVSGAQQGKRIRETPTTDARRGLFRVPPRADGSPAAYYFAPATAAASANTWLVYLEGAALRRSQTLCSGVAPSARPAARPKWHNAAYAAA